MSQPKNFVDLQEELDDLILWFESDDVDIDQAVDKFKRGQELIREIELRLKNAELEVIKIKKSS